MCPQDVITPAMASWTLHRDHLVPWEDGSVTRIGNADDSSNGAIGVLQNTGAGDAPRRTRLTVTDSSPGRAGRAAAAYLLRYKDKHSAEGRQAHASIGE